MNKKVKTMTGAIAATLFATFTHAEEHALSEPADLILTGGKIFTVNEREPWAEAVAISNGRFVYVGDSPGLERFRSRVTEVIDLEGRLVIPGLVDSHAHPGYIDVELYGEVSGATEEELLAAVERYAAAHPDAEWLRLCCWPVGLYVHGSQGPDKKTLDAVVPDRPVWFVSEWWHSGWLNSKALEVLGVDKETADPKTGVATYARDGNGEPTGWVKEGAAWQHFAGNFPIDDPEHKKIHEDSVTNALELLSAYGVTTLYDAGNFGFEDRVYGLMAELEKQGRLPVRYEGTYQVFTPDRRHMAVSEMKRYRREYGGDRLKFNTVKLFMDGIFRNRTSALLEPYNDDPSYVGDTLLSVEELRDFLLELNAARLDIHVHAEGDLAIRRVLDAVESARGGTKEQFYTRVTLSHLGLIDPADVRRIRESGVVANYTPWWFTTTRKDLVRDALGEERYDRMFTPKTLFELDVPVTLSSDEWWGGDLLATYLSPYFGMHIGHTRQYPNGWRAVDEIARRPESEKLSIEQIIEGYTLNGAYQLRLDDEIGSIEKGKVADLVVLDNDLFEVDRDKIWKVRPLAVVMEGQVIRGALP